MQELEEVLRRVAEPAALDLQAAEEGLGVALADGHLDVVEPHYGCLFIGWAAHVAVVFEEIVLDVALDDVGVRGALEVEVHGDDLVLLDDAPQDGADHERLALLVFRHDSEVLAVGHQVLDEVVDHAVLGSRH